VQETIGSTSKHGSKKASESVPIVVEIVLLSVVKDKCEEKVIDLAMERSTRIQIWVGARNVLNMDDSSRSCLRVEL